ncbi:MAG: dihydrodipicolinate synthase family protein [Planctomycetota bacterium]
MGRLQGLIAAPHSPMTAEGELDLPVIDRIAEKLVGDGVRGVFPCGTTGEFSSLSVRERQAIGQRWVDAAGDQLDVAIHVGSTALPEARALAAHAQGIGAAAIGCISPYFLRPAQVDDLVGFCQAVASAAPNLPFYYYHLPILSGVHFPVAEFLSGAVDRIPTLAGVKYSHTDLADLSACTRFRDGKYSALFGCDQMLLSGWLCGCDGAIGSTYCLIAPLYRRLLDCVERGDLETARSLQGKSVDICRVFDRYGGSRAIKAAMAFVGVDCGPPRSPLRALTRAEIEPMHAELEEIGFPNFGT